MASSVRQSSRIAARFLSRVGTICRIMSLRLRPAGATCRHTGCVIGLSPRATSASRVGVGRRGLDPDKRPQPGAPAGCARARAAPAALRQAVGGRSRGGDSGLRSRGERQDRTDAVVARVGGAGRSGRLGLSGTRRARCTALLAVGHRRARRCDRPGRAGGAGGRHAGLRRPSSCRAPAIGPALSRAAGRAGDRRSARAALGGCAAVARVLRDRAATGAATGDRHAPGPGARVAWAAAGGAADGDPGSRSALFAGGDAQADGRQRDHAVRHRVGAAS